MPDQQGMTPPGGGLALTLKDMSETAKTADIRAVRAQRMYQRLVGLEQALLVLAAGGSVITLAIGQNSLTTPLEDGVLAVLVLAVATRFLRNLTKSDEIWYNSRALAEGVQSQIWRYVMNATPYRQAPAGSVGSTPTQTAEMQLADRSRALRNSAGVDLPLPAQATEQITTAMKRAHDASLQDRVDVYKRNRLTNQRDYYQGKANQYRGLTRNWNIAIFIIEGVAVAAAAAKFIGLPSISLYGVAGTAVAGIAAWLQMKQFTTLERRYTQMVRNLQEYLDVLNLSTNLATLSPEGWSTFVDQVEQLLEHEHGSWLHLYQGLRNQQAPQQATLQEVAQQLAPNIVAPHLP